jgi:hypothetical protein
LHTTIIEDDAEDHSRQGYVFYHNAALMELESVSRSGDIMVEK